MNLQQKKILAFVYGVVVIAFGNALTAKAVLGNTSWGLACMNLAENTALTFGMAMFLLNVFALVASKVITRKIDWKKDIISLIFSFLYGYLVDIFVVMLEFYNPASYIEQSIMLSLAVVILCYGIAVYIKVDFFLLPFDYLMIDLKDCVFNGDIKKAGYVSNGLGIAIALISGLTGTLVGFNLWSIGIYLVFSPLIDFWLKHTKKLSAFLELNEQNVDASTDGSAA